MKYAISIIHPSRNRPTQAMETVKKWLSQAKNPKDIEYVISLDSSDPKLEAYRAALQTIEKPYNLGITLHDNHTAIEAINNTAKLVSGNLLIVVSDDFDCPNLWDVALLDALKGKKDFIVKTKDGLQPELITLPIMDRAYYERFGYIYFPQYQHMFCDTEMTDVGHLLGKVIKLPITFYHRHYSTGLNKRDEISEKNDSTWKQGETLYNMRKVLNFGLLIPATA